MMASRAHLLSAAASERLSHAAELALNHTRKTTPARAGDGQVLEPVTGQGDRSGRPRMRRSHLRRQTEAQSTRYLQGARIAPSL